MINSTQFFLLNLVGWLVFFLTNLLFFDILSLCYYINLRSSISFGLSSGDIYFSLGISFFIILLCNCLWIILLWILWNFCDFISYQISSCFCYFLNYHFWTSCKSICSRFFSMIKEFLVVLTTHDFTYILTDIFAHAFNKR